MDWQRYWRNNGERAVEMRTIAFLLFFIFIVLAGTHFYGRAPEVLAMRYREDADTARLQHLVYWSGLIEEYHAATGEYPLQDWIQPGEHSRMVRIQTKAQRGYVTKDSGKYSAAADVNPDGEIPEASMKDFVATLEAGLKRYIEEKYDIQSAPVNGPIGYYYTVTHDGYVLRATCLRCAGTEISSLMANGQTPVINIASAGMVEAVPKAKTRDDMLQDPIFKRLADVAYQKESYVRALERKHVHDSK